MAVMCVRMCSVPQLAFRSHCGTAVLSLSLSYSANGLRKETMAADEDEEGGRAFFVFDVMSWIVLWNWAIQHCTPCYFRYAELFESEQSDPNLYGVDFAFCRLPGISNSAWWLNDGHKMVEWIVIESFFMVRSAQEFSKIWRRPDSKSVMCNNKCSLPPIWSTNILWDQCSLL